MNTYAELDAELHHKRYGTSMNSRRLTAKCSLQRRGQFDIAVHLWHTDILIFHPNETVTLNHNGWTTNLTSKWINRYLYSRVGSVNNHYWLRVAIPFEDGWIPVEIDMTSRYEQVVLQTQPIRIKEHSSYSDDWWRQLNPLHSFTLKTIKGDADPDYTIQNTARRVADSLIQATKTKPVRSQRELAHDFNAQKRQLDLAFASLETLREWHDNQMKAWNQTEVMNQVGLTQLEEAILNYAQRSTEGDLTGRAIMTADADFDPAVV